MNVLRMATALTISMSFLLSQAGIPLRLFPTVTEAQNYQRLLLPQQLDSVTFTIYELLPGENAELVSQYFHRAPASILERRRHWSDGVRVGTSL